MLLKQYPFPYFWKTLSSFYFLSFFDLEYFATDCPPSACGMGTECCRVKKADKHDHAKKDEEKPKTEEGEGKKENGNQPQEADAFAEPIFPPALMKYPALPLRLVGDRVILILRYISFIYFVLSYFLILFDSN